MGSGFRVGSVGVFRNGWVTSPGPPLGWAARRVHPRAASMPGSRVVAVLHARARSRRPPSWRLDYDVRGALSRRNGAKSQNRARSDNKAVSGRGAACGLAARALRGGAASTASWSEAGSSQQQQQCIAMPISAAVNAAVKAWIYGEGSGRGLRAHQPSPPTSTRCSSFDRGATGEHSIRAWIISRSRVTAP